MNFGTAEDPWPYRIFWFLAIVWFILPAWVGPAVDEFSARVKEPLPAGAVYAAGLPDSAVIDPQTRLLLFICPPLEDKYPLEKGPELPHRIIFSLFYAAAGWACVRLTCALNDGWWLRGWWLFIYWAVYAGFMQVVSMLFVHFGVIH